MKKLAGESKDIEKENLAAMQQLFPEAFEEGKIDFDALRQLLGDYVDDEEERYSFRWNGKGKALRLSQTPSTGTLRPCKEESKNWDTTENLYIEGDNLEVLKLLQKSYHGKVKMIYIDPPYNTGKDFVYKDDFRDNVANYKRITGQVDDEGHRTGTNGESNGRFHTDWLNMMYPRLRLARNLLKMSGAVFIHIDENEIYNLSRICDEVFGSNNELGTIIWDKRNPKGAPVGVAYQHESILVYAKDRNEFMKTPFMKKKEHAARMLEISKKLLKKHVVDMDLVRQEYKRWIRDNRAILSGGEAAYSEIDDEGHIYRIVSMAAPDNPNKRSHRPLIHPITNKPCPIPTKGWRFTDANMDRLLEEGRIVFGDDETTQPGQKYFLEDNMEEAVASILYFGGSADVLGVPFDTPKPLEIAKKIIYSLCKSRSEDRDIILDFFSGSATTAHAVMNLNAEDGGNRRFILVQLPETTPVDSEARKAGYENICEIGKERIRRAGEKIKAECEDAERAASLDIGFKVFKLDSSNLRKWQPQPEDLQGALQESMDNFLPGRTELDVVYEIALKLGLDLSYEVEEREVDGQTIYIIGAGALMICLDSQISMETAEALLKLHEEYEPETWQVVFRDTGFLSDQEKTNIKETLKSAGLDEDAFISI